jgi:hypothetical protein
MMLTDVIDAYLTRQRSLGMRFDSAGQLLHRFGRAMGERPIEEVTPGAILDFLNGNGALSAPPTPRRSYRPEAARRGLRSPPVSTSLVTVERAMPSRRAISCVDKPENFSRIISRASRISIRSAGIDSSLGVAKGTT